MDVLLTNPRGFCAGVDRAIEIVERALEIFGDPVYVWHEIVHNRTVVENLRAKGARFVESHDEVPPGSVLVFSAHGVSKGVVQGARELDCRTIDATCPLVTKVHLEAFRFHRQGYALILIGHAGHPEVAGTMGQLPEGAVTLVETPEEAARVTFPEGTKVACLTQTTLSLDETRGIVKILKERLPSLAFPSKDDICYATQNRQTAVKDLAGKVDVVFVLGAPNSSNSNRLREVAAGLGTPSYLIESVRDIRAEWLEGASRAGVTAGASAPEVLVQEVVDFLRARDGGGEVEEIDVVTEDVTFPLPREIVGVGAPATNR